MMKPVAFAWGLALLAGLVWAATPPQQDASARQQEHAAEAHVAHGPKFQTSDRCMPCHNGVVTPQGEDISFGLLWRASVMANSSRDPYWQASVRRETLDHPQASPDIEDECSTCHMPMARYDSKLRGQKGQVFAHLGFDQKKEGDRLAEDGVSCSLCHQITNDKLGTRQSFVGGFVIDATQKLGNRRVFGPFEIDPGRSGVMRSSSGFRPTQGDHIRESELCATCHTLYTQALNSQGQVIGQLPEQMPYLEWLHSDYRNRQSCQNCHMPVVAGEAPITSVLPEMQQGVSRHEFPGGNFLLLKMLNRYRNDLAVAALPQELENAADSTARFLQSQAAKVSINRVQVSSGRLTADIAVENLGGHKLPTAYPSRRAWLHVVVRDRNHTIVFESGALTPQGSIVGNDNDADPARFEPHYREITRPDQVQIYESIMVTPAGAVTTGLLSAIRYAKDNRLLPRGFDKQNAEPDVAVVGSAAQDEDFTGGGDQIRYSIDLGQAQGPFDVQAELWYQPIGYRWASNLRPYQAREPQRFTRYYDSLASASAVVLARASATEQ